MSSFRTSTTGIVVTLLLLSHAAAAVYYADPGALNDGNLYVDIPTNVTNIRGVYIVGKRGDMDTAFWGPRTNEWQPFLNAFGFVMAYRTQGEALCPEERAVPQTTLAALTDIAAQSGHPELAHAPVFIFGFSGDAAGPAAMAEVFPGRTLGGVWHSTADNCSYGDEASQTNELFHTPTLEINCALDSWGWSLIHLWTTMSNYADRVITGSVAWTHAQQGGGHGAAMNRSTLQFPWILSVVSQRLPSDSTPYTNLPVLSRLDTNLLWHGDQGERGLFQVGQYLSNFDSNGQSRTVGSFQIWAATNPAPPGLSPCPTWSAMPDQAFARVWQTYCDMTNAAVAPSGNDAALNIQTVAVLPGETVSTEESGRKLRFIIVRSRKTASPLQVPFSLAGTAMNGGDYEAVTNFICTIPGGEWSGQVEISPLDDFTPEGPESVVLKLTANTNFYYVHGPGALAATLSDDESASPAVLARSPTNGTPAFIGTNLVLTFSRQMAAGSGLIVVTNLTDPSTVLSVDASDSRVSISGTTVSIALPGYLDPETYAVLVAPGALEDTQGHPFAGLASPSDWSFGAMAYDTNAPLVMARWPVQEATHFNRFEDLQLTFNELVQAGAGIISISNLTLNRNTEQIPVTDTARVFFQGSNVMIRPFQPLSAGHRFCVRIQPGVMTDTFPPAPNGFAGFATTSDWTFVTKADPGPFTETFDTENAVGDPTFTTNLYGAFGGVSNVQYSWYKLFSATGSACTLIDGNGVVIESPNGGASHLMTEFLPNIGALAYQLRQAVPGHTPGFYNRTRVLAITRGGVTNQLKLYDYVSAPGVATVTNMNLVPLNEPVRLQIVKTLDDFELTLDNLTWTPHLPADTTAPVATFLPGTGAIELPTSQVLVVRFDEDLQAADGSPMSDALALASFSLTNVLTGTAVPFSAAYGYEMGLPQFTLTPLAPLEPFTSYQLALKPSAVRDLNGNTNLTGARALLTTAPAVRHYRETFANNNASTNSNPNLWGGGSFVGDEGLVWTFNSAGSAGYASGQYQLDGRGLVLRSSGSNGLVTAVNVPGGVGSLMVVFRNGDGTAGARKVALEVSGQRYESASVDSADASLFRVDHINEAGNENTYNTIILSNATTKSTTIDSMVWTTYRDPLQVLASTTSLSVAEGGAAAVMLTLNYFPEGKATVTVQRISGVTNIQPATSSFVLDEQNWDSGVSVSFVAGEDTDVLNDAAQFTFSAPDVVSATVVVTQVDNDTGPEVSATHLMVREGATNSFLLRLTRMPQAGTTVVVSRISGDADLTVAGPAAFEFTTGNWDAWQMVYLTAAPDGDAYDSSASFSVASVGVDPVLVTAIERDAAWTNWVAFHDMSTNAVGDAPYVTKGFTHDTAHTLVNAVNTQALTNITLTLRYYDKNGVAKPASVSQSATGIASPANGTDAARIFTNHLRPDVVYQLAATSDYAVTTISGLAPDRVYGIALYHNRGQAFPPRTKFTLLQATNFTACGSAGIGDAGDSDPATYEVSLNNTASGYVAMWTNITPTGDAGTSFAVRQDNFGTGTVFRLAQAYWITGEQPPTNAEPPALFTLTVNAGPGGSVSPTGGTYAADSVVAISANASSYYHFVSWTGALTSVHAVTNLTMHTNLTVGAIFAETLATNGTPHWWLAGHGFPATDAGALGDADFDGMVSWEEWVAGTNPTNAASRLEASQHLVPGTGLVVAWPAASGRWYTIYHTTNLLNTNAWPLLAETSGSSITDELHQAESRGFYRLEVRLEP